MRDLRRAEEMSWQGLRAATAKARHFVVAELLVYFSFPRSQKR
jgi:hypothetical protein